MTTVSRRSTLRKAGASLTALAAVGGGVLLSGSEPALAASGLTADDVTVTTNDGQLNTLTITPDITVSWTGMQEQVATVAVTWFVKTNATSETHFGSNPKKLTVDTPLKQGSLSHTYSSPLDLLNVLSASTFEATTDGGSTSTDVTLSMNAELRNSNSGTITSKTDVLGPKTYTVTVKNESSSVSSSGTANTGGS